jgi:hypothetical protein
MTDGVLVDFNAIAYAALVSLPSAGRQKCKLGIARRCAAVSTGWCVGPSSPRPIESWVAVVRRWAALRQKVIGDRHGSAHQPR